MFCRNCGKELPDSPELCPSCGVSPMTSFGNIYNPDLDLSGLANEERSAFLQHSFGFTFSVDAVIGLHLLTLGLFSLIHFGLKHSQLPMIKHDDFKARRAIGFMFIPFFNLYWQFRFWLRLVDRVNFQLRLRGLPFTVSRGLMLATIIVGLVPVANLAALLVMYPICIVQIERACNLLAGTCLQSDAFQIPENLFILGET